CYRSCQPVLKPFSQFNRAGWKKLGHNSRMVGQTILVEASYYRARYYDPQTGKFLSEDQLRFFSGDVNFYAYVFNGPTNYDDPSGYSCTCTYSQSTGHLVCKDSSGNKVVDVTGYSGYGPGKNNPEAQGTKCATGPNCISAGPIPVGTYDLLPAVNGPLGKPQIPLRRQGGRSGGFPQNRDPDSFLIHADSTTHPGEASHGCIIAKDANDRKRIADCGGGTVEVNP
ncbi:MAG TPA: RHS repeat-associated core domain-containing protein, partial [Candidatus Acidoferrum sp.]|nr:RHS repeat-associated core domain-containing protein [Candidatus Acidoferrum sp.]